MNSKCKRGIASFLVLALIAVLCLGCGDDGDEDGKVVITIGHIMDFTGASSSMARDNFWPVADMVRYTNEEDPIPGVKLEHINFDAAFDPAKDIPGYEWCRERGADLIYVNAPHSGDILKTFAERDTIVVLSTSCTRYQIDPPGWVFCFTPPSAWQIKTILKWLSEDWDYSQGKPRLGAAGYQESYHLEIDQAIREYVSDHPDQFDFVDGLIAPVGTMTWAGEVEALKDCDYVYLPVGPFAANFATDYRERGYTAKFIGTEAMTAFRGPLVDKAGWDVYDGSLNMFTGLFWNDQYPSVDLATELLYRYHPSEADEVVHSGLGYISGMTGCAMLMIEMLRQTIETVGAENFSSQSFYDTLVKFKTKVEGCEEWGYSETVRYTRKHMAPYEWSKEAGDVVRIGDWVPILVD